MQYDDVSVGDLVFYETWERAWHRTTRTSYPARVTGKTPKRITIRIEQGFPGGGIWEGDFKNVEASSLSPRAVSPKGISYNPAIISEAGRKRLGV